MTTDKFTPTVEFEVQLLKAATMRFPNTRWVLRRLGETEIMSDFEMECYYSESLSARLSPLPQPEAHIKDMDFMFLVYPCSDLITVCAWWRTEIIYYWCDDRVGMWVNSLGREIARPIPHGQELEEIALIIQQCGKSCWDTSI